MFSLFTLFERSFSCSCGFVSCLSGAALPAGLTLDRDVLLDDLCELLLVDFGPNDEFMLKKFGCRRSSLRVLSQALFDEIGEEGRPLAGYRRWLQAHNVENDLALTLLDVRWIAIGHLVGEDAKTPDVDLAVIFFLSLDELRCHPADRAYATRAMLSFACQLR